MKIFKVNYNGKIYTNYKYPFFIDTIKTYTLDVYNVPENILCICNFEENDDYFIINLGKLVFDIDNENNGIFKENFYKTIKFDKNSFKAIGDKIVPDDFIKGDDYFYFEFDKFLDKIISLNNNISEHLLNIPKYLKVKPDGSLIYTTTMTNFYNLLIFNYQEYEKLITSDSCSILEANLFSKNFSIEEASKLSVSLGIPKFALPIIKDLNLEGCIQEIRNISKKIDGNSLKIIFNFIDRLSIIFKHNVPVKNRPVVMKKFLSDICDCLDNGYKITDLLNYLLRQNLYFSETQIFSFPYNEAMYLADYIKMSNKYNIKVDKYPSQLKRQHDILSKNIMSLSFETPELENKFIESVNKYKSVEKEISYKYTNDSGEEVVENYLFIVPKKIRDIVEEGTNLHHCVGSYSDRIINELSRIVFMREKDFPKKSLITIDIDNDYNLTEAKKAFNEEVDEIHQKVINKWLKEIKK